MSLIPNRAQDSPVDQAAAARNLVRRCGMSEADVDRIIDYQRTEELSFTEAALRLGLATQAEVDLALEKPQEQKPQQKGKASGELRLVSEPFSDYAEALRSLRTELMLRRAGDDYRGLAVVSATAGDGRSHLAAELAIVFSQLEEPTLLVDADLRGPRQHHLFKLPGEVGLVQALEHESTPRIYGIEDLPHLSVLPAGEVPDNPIELLMRPAFAEVLRGFARRYAHVILDTPAAGKYSDALAVARHAGLVLLVVRKDRSSLPALQALQRRLATTQAQVLGAALLGG